MYQCVCVCAIVFACVHASMRSCIRAFVCACAFERKCAGFFTFEDACLCVSVCEFSGFCFRHASKRTVARIVTWTLRAAPCH